MYVHEELNRDLVIIPITDRSKKPEVAYSKHDGVTVINITKPEQAECFICKFCSVTLKSLTRLEKHKEEKHGNEKLYYCDDCSISKKKMKELRDHQRSHKTSVCPGCEKAISLKYMSKHMKICQGHESKFQCDQCDSRTFYGLRMHKTKFHELLEPIIRLTIVYE